MSACLMAEYAFAWRCVRAAARGFSPDRNAGMPRGKVGRGLLFQFMLESRRRLSPAAQAWAEQQMPAAFVWKRRQLLQKRTGMLPAASPREPVNPQALCARAALGGKIYIKKYLMKKRKNQRQFYGKSFLNCFLKGHDVLYYGLWPEP